MNKWLLGVGVIFLSVFAGYLYWVSQTWTTLPLSYCTEITGGGYDDFFVPIRIEGPYFMYSPDDGFNTCRTHIGTVIAPGIALVKGAAILALGVFWNGGDE